MTFMEMLNQWLTAYVDGADLAPSTKAMYHRAARAVPLWLQETPSDKLNPLLLMRWLNEVKQTHPRAAQLDRVMLCRCLRVCAKLGLCPAMVLDDDTMPKPKHRPKETPVLDQQTLTAYIHAAKEASATDPAAILLLLCCCGLRRGEALGLRPTDYEPLTGVLHINRQRQRINGEYTEAPLKSRSSYRALVLP